MSVFTQAVSKLDMEQSIDTGIVQTGGYTYRLMLVDSSYAPLCAAWKK